MLLLGCICFPAFSSVKAYAAEPSPDAANQWYLLPFDTVQLSKGAVKGTFSAEEGTYTATGNDSNTWPAFICSDQGGVFPALSAGHTYCFYYTLSGVGDFPQISGFALRSDYSDPSVSYYLGPVLSRTRTYVTSTTTLSGIYQFTPDTDIMLSTGSGILFNMTGGAYTTSARMTWAFYALDVTGMGEDEVVAAINAQTQVIQQGQQQDQQRYDDFTQGGDSSEFDSAKDQIEGKIGIFTALDELLQGVFGVFTAGTADAAQITFPAFALTVEGEEHEVWTEQTVNLDDMFTGPLAALKTALNFATVAAVYYALIRYLIRVYDQIFGGGER